MNRSVFIVLLGCLFMAMLGMNIISPLLPVYAVRMGASSTEIGLVQAAFSISGICTLLFVGRLSDRLGRKLFLGCSLVILVISSAGLMFATRPGHLIVLRFIQGLGSSTFLAISQAYMGDAVQAGDEGRWVGYFNAVLFAGMGAGPVAGGIFADAFGISTAFMLLAIMNFAGLILMIVFVKERPRKVAAREHASIAAPLKSRVIRAAISYRMGIGVCTATLMAFVPMFAGLRIGMSPTIIGILLAARIPISMAQLYTGRMSDRWDRRQMVIWSGILCAAAVALMPQSGGFWSLMFLYLAVTTGQALGIPAANAYVVREGRVFGMGVSVTLFMLAMYVGNGIGPIALGAIADTLGLDAAFYGAAFCMGIGVVLFSMLLRKPGGMPVPESG